MPAWSHIVDFLQIEDNNARFLSHFLFILQIKFMTTIDIPEDKGTFVLSIMGFADLIGRGGSALIGDYLPFHCVYVYPIFNGFMGVATFCLLMVNNITGMFVYAFGEYYLHIFSLN